MEHKRTFEFTEEEMDFLLTGLKERLISLDARLYRLRKDAEDLYNEYRAAQFDSISYADEDFYTRQSASYDAQIEEFEEEQKKVMKLYHEIEYKRLGVDVFESLFLSDSPDL